MLPPPPPPLFKPIQLLPRSQVHPIRSYLELNGNIYALVGTLKGPLLVNGSPEDFKDHGGVYFASKQPVEDRAVDKCIELLLRKHDVLKGM